MNNQKKRLIGAKILTFFVIVLMFVSNTHTNILMDVIGFLLIVLAGVGRIWSSAYISGFKSGKVVKDGPYSMMRNPLYFFSFLGFIGVGLVFGSLLISFLLVVIFLITHLPTIKYEEKKLEELFGDEYREYFKTTPRFFPNISQFSNPEVIEFYPRKFTKTLVEATYLIFSYGLVKLLVWAHENEVLPNLITLY
jgi:protein-S-isoprenylcysteine O-methyltransferase Ste14